MHVPYSLFSKARLDGEETPLLCKIHCGLFVTEENETGAGSGEGECFGCATYCSTLISFVQE